MLKGGVLLAAYDLRRPTADVDLAVAARSNEVEQVRLLVTSIAQIALTPGDDDGLRFDTGDVRAVAIREEVEYHGVRVTLTARLATSVQTFHVDVNVGDPIWPAPRQVELPRLLGGQISLTGYPIAMVLAEKIVTALQRGPGSTRWRDFADIYLLAGRHELDAAEIRGAVTEVARYRGVQLQPLSAALQGYADLGQVRWRLWRDRQHLQDRLPGLFADALDVAIRLADPLLGPTSPPQGRWSPAARARG